jgi:peptidoglycan/xylan/chitin deacetylase (PgdA/CDA1 family)
LVKPVLPRRIQVFLRVKEVAIKRGRYNDTWPILEGTDKQPGGWRGWPDGKKFALILTHDVDTARGHDRCRDLMKMEEKLGFRSLFNFVPERYAVSAELRAELERNGFEIGVHGLNHDGKLFQSKAIFEERAIKINRYLKQWNAVGFRSPAMHHNLEWMASLNIEYDLSTFDTDPFEPQSDGVKTIYPFKVNAQGPGNDYIEMPYSLPQDFTIFILMRERSIDIWKKKLDWIAEKGGMALINTHPDYMHFGMGSPDYEEYPAEYYNAFLEYVSGKYPEQYWHVLPKNVASFWKALE